MKIYLVGGAVRDQLLALTVTDRDWLVVGATAEELIAQGYQQVGKDFPVFLHPVTKEEYALARTERKSGRGYKGFICDFSPQVTLEQDLIRRDLSINAIAKDETGKLYDFFGGIQDIKNRLLRHISPAFVEDPLRVLRVARFAARFHYLGFSVAPETLELMKQISQSGELKSLTAERIWFETERALLTKNPEVFFQTLKQVGALAECFAELDALAGVPNPIRHHPEIDSFIHSMLVLQQSVILTENTDSNKVAIRFAALCHDLGKAITDKSHLPHHPQHEQAGVDLVKQLCERLRVPKYVQQLAELACQYHGQIHKALKLDAKEILALFNQLDVWRRPERFNDLLLVCIADSRGRTGFEDSAYPQADYLQQLHQAAQAVDVQQLITQGFRQQQIREQLNKHRQQAIDKRRQEILVRFTNNQ